MSEAPNIAEIALGISTHLRNNTDSRDYFYQKLFEDDPLLYGIFKGKSENDFKNLRLIASVHYADGAIIAMTTDKTLISQEKLEELVKQYVSA